MTFAASQPPAPPLVLACLLLVCITPEVVLTLADWGLTGNPRWRMLAYQNGAFWAGLLRDWQPNFASQPVTMFVTHAFLHAGPAHLVGNMLALVVLWQRLAAHQTAQRLLAIYACAAIGGGIAFGLLSTTPAPMIGASGAIFGLAGAAVVASRTNRVWLAAGLALLNVIVWWWQNGQLAWETHLGGFVVGVVMTAGKKPA